MPHCTQMTYILRHVKEVCENKRAVLAYSFMTSLLPYVQVILSVILIALILLQRTGAQVGGAFGGSDNWSSAYHTRRGMEKWLFTATIIVAIIFAVSALLNLVLK
jgi:protein translocase SecG subunit